jgi:hypothetical protein
MKSKTKDDRMAGEAVFPDMPKLLNIGISFFDFPGYCIAGKRQYRK